MPSPMNREGDGDGDAPPSLIAELDARPARRRRARPGRWCSIPDWAAFRCWPKSGACRPDVEIVYAADDAAFPYGRLSEEALVARVKTVMARLIGETEPDIVVIACSTASTFALPPLRAAYPRLPFVGTVPAIKPAAAASRSGLISVLATRGTVARDYTQALVRDYAGELRGDTGRLALLAVIAERVMRGEAVDEARSSARSRRASLSATAGARIRSCSPARIFR